MMDWKLCGMALIFGASTWTGFQAAASVRKCCRQLQQLRLSLELMRCEISCRRTPIRQLTQLLASSCKGEVSGFYACLADGLADGKSVAEAAAQARGRCRLCLPPEASQSLDGLFGSFGGYDAEAQLRLIELAQTKVAAALEELTREQKSRCRCYELLGACTGLSLAILAA